MTQSSLFNNPKENIKVGYIDPKLGYVSNVSVCEANEYAELNPGTTFIFTDGNDNIRYLRIKEVNELTAKDLVRTKECDPDFVKCGPPKIQIFGGGGIGAAANPIISPESGAIISADLIRGGHGYKIEPFAQAIDECNRGAGAVFETRVGIVTTEDEVFDKEDDFEVYNICPDTTVNPRMWGPEGEDLGEWNPDKYFNVDKDQDPIQREIEKYQKYLKSYTNPWWDSRKKSPRLVTGDGKSFNKVYPVTHVGTGVTTTFVELKSENPPPPPPPSPIQEVEFNLYRENGMPGDANGGISNIQITFTPIQGEGEPFSFVNDTPNKKIVKKKVSVYKNTVYRVTSTLTETAKDKHETVEQGTLESRNSESTSWARGTGSATYKEFNKPSTVMFADALPTANDNDDFIISVPTGFGIFKTGNKKKVSTSDGSQSRSYWDIEYVLEAPTAPPTDSDTNPNLKAKFVKKDGGIYLDTTGFSGNVEIDLKYLIADPLKGGDGYAALNFKIPGTPISFSRKDPVTGAIKDRDSLQQKYTVEGGKFYGPVVFSGGAAHATFELAGETTIASLDPKSAAQLNRERTNLNQVERDFDVIINSSRGNAKSASPTLIGISTEFRVRTWNDFMNTYAVSPVPDSTLPGSDFPNILFSIEWEENFPYAGEYIFRGCRDNVAQLYVDNLYISDLQNFNQEPKPVPVQMTEGNHIIRVDLLNIPIKEKITVDTSGNYTPNPSETAAPSPTTPNISKNDAANLINFAGGGKGGIIPRGTLKYADGGVGLGEYLKILEGKGRPVGSGGPTKPESSTAGPGGGGASHVSSRAVNFRGRQAYAFRGADGGGGGGLTLLGDRVNDFKNAVQYGNEDGTGGDGTGFGGGGGAGRPGRKAGNGANGAVRIEVGGKEYEYTTPGRYELVVPTDLNVNSNTGLTAATIICIGGGGSGYSDTKTDAEWVTEWKVLTGGKVSNPTQKQLDDIKKNYTQRRTNHPGTGGGGGCWHLNDRARLKPGSVLEIVVGAGGIAPTVGTGSRGGGDSYVRVLREPSGSSSGASTSSGVIDKDADVNPNSRTTSTKTDAGSTVTKVFNTIDYITKANRPLWRINPTASKTSSLIDRYGICPFDTKTAEAQKSSYAGTHEIIWENINFPVDGYYRISLAVDDNVTLWIGNRGSGGTANDGSGRIYNEGDVGDEVIIRHEGFFSPGKSRGDLVTTKFFKAGNYRIRADLEQIEVGPIAKGNPMALAINIETSYIETEVIASRSWQQNPMGVALTIQAPEVPVPQEQPPPQIGRCPSNPFWTTRFPGSKQKWYPVRYDGAEIVDIKVNTDEFKTDNQPQDNGSLTEEVELVLYRANGERGRGNIFVKFEPTEGEGEVIRITNDLDNKVPTKKKITIFKNTTYKVTSGLTQKAPANQELVEQGTLELREGDSSDTPWVKKENNVVKELNKPSSILFADALPSANDNNDFIITLPKGKGVFKPFNKKKIKTTGDNVQNRNTWEINYILEAPVATKNTVKASTGSEVTASGAPGGSVTKAKAKFVRRPDDNQFYLDLTQFSGKVEVELKFDIADRISGGSGGSAATRFEIPGTTISYDRFNYTNEKITERGVQTRRFIVDGGRAYGPIKTSGGSTNYGPWQGQFQTFKFDDNTLSLLDPHSAHYDELRRSTAGGYRQEEITQILKKIAKNRSDGKRDYDITILGVNPASLSAISDAESSSGTKPNSNRYAGRFTGDSPDAIENGSTTTVTRRVTRTTGWSKFTNRYAISPVPPLGSRGSDRAGITFSNTWDIDIPFTAFYGFKATADNQGRILLDGEEILKAEHFLTDSPKSVKKRIERGRHQLTVEVYNKPQFVTTTERQKVFSTQDWQVSKQDSQKKMVEVQFNLATAAKFVNRLEIVGVFNEVGPTYERGSKIPNQLKKVINASIEVGKVYEVIVRNEDKRSPRMNLRSKGQLLEVEDWTDFNWTDYLCSSSAGRFYDVDGDKCKFIVDPDPPQTSSSRTVNGVTYEGPELFGYKHNAWSDFMNKYSVSPVITPLDQQNPTVKYVRIGNDIFLDTTQFEGDVEIGIKYDINDVQNKKGDGLAALKFEIPGTPISFDRNETGVTITNTGGKAIERKYIVTGGSLYGPVVFSGGNGTPTILENSSTVMSLDQKTNSEFEKKGFKIFSGGVNRDFDATIQSVTGQAKVKKQSNNELVGDKILLWKNVNFPVTAQYLIELQADNVAQLKIDGQEIHRTVDFRANVIPFFASVTKGAHDIEIVLTNAPPIGLNADDQTFDENPTGVALIISVDITNRSVNPLAWQDDNPMGISAVMIAPPCPKPTSGKGVVTDIIPIDPGNGYAPPLPGPTTYPVTLTVSEVIVNSPGINYNCGIDEIVIEPSNGAQLDYVCDSFGRISSITVVNPGLGFTSLPRIDIISSTGINFSATPVLKPVRDPIGVEEDKLIQVTDLVGLKQTGYIQGRAYYGAVFFENGVKYAGYYRTAGDLVQVYDTLQESIDATVTTPPSAIERSGTDPGSNNPRLNIPGTPENLRDLNQ